MNNTHKLLQARIPYNLWSDLKDKAKANGQSLRQLVTECLLDALVVSKPGQCSCGKKIELKVSIDPETMKLWDEHLKATSNEPKQQR